MASFLASTPLAMKTTPAMRASIKSAIVRVVIRIAKEPRLSSSKLGD
jgi:hypothetical protein